MSSSYQFDAYQPAVKRVIENIEKVIVGKRDVAELSLVALLAGSHVLLEDVPGVGKTMMVRALAKSVGARFNRIQFTPDLLPSDLTGVSIFNQREMKFEFRKGPLLGNIVLADEINRTSPKTQSALLEGMEEGSVTVDGDTHILPQPFFVMATQNPIEYEGTYPLPEAQLDRFLLKLRMGYPSPEEELEVLNRTEHAHPIDSIGAALELEELLDMQRKVKAVFVEGSVKQYIIDIVSRTRNNTSIYLGASPRGSLSLMKACQAYAFMRNRDYVLPDDVKFLAPYVLSHRIILKSEAAFEGQKPEEIIKEIIHRVRVPLRREEKVK
ncbi:AAA family ATPase [Guptibacillus hwajinpoensis]|uniref:MoxR-like ATPase n=1 Tax=Guptibacillus hwajinpoensis TaxID=208199 RepID=A0ABU0K720_9BACL|nr:MoxR family ATPase [Alkalihalobacillus hemicentroti]MDQ0485145.1 MoxR-like ATPase [Alkalihalobacillus hemicentroti]